MSTYNPKWLHVEAPKKPPISNNNIEGVPVPVPSRAQAQAQARSSCHRSGQTRPSTSFSVAAPFPNPSTPVSETRNGQHAFPRKKWLCLCASSLIVCSVHHFDRLEELCSIESPLESRSSRKCAGWKAWLPLIGQSDRWLIGFVLDRVALKRQQLNCPFLQIFTGAIRFHLGQSQPKL